MRLDFIKYCSYFIITWEKTPKKKVHENESDLWFYSLGQISKSMIFMISEFFAMFTIIYVLTFHLKGHSNHFL